MAKASEGEGARQVSIQAIEAVAGVGVKARLGLHVPNVVHDLVLSFPRDLGSRARWRHFLSPSPSPPPPPHVMAAEDDLHLLPAGVTGQLLVHKELELGVQPCHELGARGDAVGVKARLRGQHLPLLQSLANKVLGFTGRTKSATAEWVSTRTDTHTGDREMSPSTSLLIHFGSRSNTVHCQEKDFLGFDNPKQHLDGMKT